MSNLQIESLVLYNDQGDQRMLPFRIGGVSIVTGRSKSGKSAIIDIVDYCLGQRRARIPEGVIMDTVAWYGIRLQLPGQQVFIARPRLEPNRASTNQAYVELADSVDIPPFAQLSANTTTEAVEELLTSLVGIQENVHRTPDGQTRPDLEANIRHALFYVFQQQDEIAQRYQLFHRQGEESAFPRQFETRCRFSWEPTTRINCSLNTRCGKPREQRS